MSARCAAGRRSWRRRLSALVAAGTVLACVAPAPALAHSVLVRSVPAADAELRTAPAAVELDFNEAVQAGYGSVRVFDAGGRRVDGGPPAAPQGSQSAVAVPLQAGLPRGVYTATYRIVSADGHPVAGAFSFGVGVAVTAANRPPAAALAARARGGRTLEGLYGLARGLHYAALLLLIGAVFTRLLVWPAHTKRRWPVGLMAGTVALGAFCALYAVALQGVLATGAPLAHALDATVVRSALDSRAGHTWLVRLLAWVLAGVLLTQFPRLETRGEAFGLGAPALLLAGSLPFAGHAATNSPSGVLAVADVVHVLAAGAWLGGLVFLLTSFWPRRSDPVEPDAGEATARFSRMALPAIAILVAAGLLQAWFYLGSVGALVHGTYGLALTAKILLLGGIVALGAGNRRHTARLAGGDVATGRSLRRSMRAEVVLAVLVLAATATLVRAAPPVDAALGPVTRDVPAGPLRIRLQVPLARVGANDVQLTLFDRRTGAPVSRVAQLTLDARLPARGIGPLRFEARRVAPGRYEVRSATLGVPGRWQLALTARVSEFDEFTGRTELLVQR